MTDDLTRIFQRFNPDKALTNGELKDFFVEIDENKKRIKKLETRLKMTIDINEPMKLLFMGHRGSGKTTALNKLVCGLDDSFFIVYYDVMDLLDPNDVSYTDVLFSILTKLTEKSEQEDIHFRDKLTQRIEKWGGTLIKTETQTNEMITGSGLTLPVYFINLFLRMKNENQTRSEVRKEMTPRISELISLINDTVIEIEEKCKKQVLIIIDNLEKVEYEKAMDIFANHGTQITQPECKIIYTFPIALRSCDKYSQIRTNFSADIMYPSIKVHDKEGKMTEDVLKNRKFMKEIFKLRGDLKFIDQNALDHAIDMSGGVLREYIRIIRDSALNSIAFEKDLIDIKSVKDTVNDLKNSYMAQLSDEDYKVLEHISIDKKIKRDDDLVRLLHNLSVLEYANGDNWCDINPIVRLLMEEQSS